MDAKIGTFIVGIANNVGCYLPIILLNSKICPLDKFVCIGFGRKTLLTASFGVMFISLALIALGIKL